MALISGGAAQAQFISIPLGGPHPAKPSPNRDQLGAPADVAAALASPGRPAAMVRRDDSQHPAEVLAFLGLWHGARVLDVEADPGYYGEIIGSAVGPGGRVLAVVPPAGFTDPGQRAARSDLIARVPTLTPLADGPAAFRLPPDSFDFALFDRTYHRRRAQDAAGTAALLATIFAALRPGGVVGVIDYRSGNGPAADPGRLDPAAVVDDFRRAGFVFDSESSVLRNAAGDHAVPVDAGDDPATADRFVLRFRKPDS